MTKRFLDIVLSAFGLVASAPVLLPAMLLVWLQDFRSPLYIASRVGYRGTPFRMVKLRSMTVRTDGSGPVSTAANDARLTPIGAVIRACKLDEMSQLWNVLRGDMSLVGPRPNVESETARYTAAERRVLDAKPGITDISSIVFSDEGAILAGSADPDLDYNRLIRPWKSRLALLYVDKRSLALDIGLIGITVIAIVSRRLALRLIAVVLARVGAPAELRDIAARRGTLLPSAPPGADRPVSAADLYGTQALA